MAEIDTTSSIASPPSEIQVSVQGVIDGLYRVRNAYPDLDLTMELAIAMLVRLDTIRDEVKLRANIAIDGNNASQLLEDIVSICGPRNKRHVLAIPRRFVMAMEGAAA